MLEMVNPQKGKQKKEKKTKIYSMYTQVDYDFIY